MSESFFRKFYGESGVSIVERLRSLADDIERAPETDFAKVLCVGIEDWMVGTRSVPCLIGSAAGHPKVAEGRPMITSELFYLDEERGVARTYSRWYRLLNKVDAGLWQ